MIYGGGLKAKGFAIACVASMAAGWLSRQLVHGKVSADDRALLLLAGFFAVGWKCVMVA